MGNMSITGHPTLRQIGKFVHEKFVSKRIHIEKKNSACCNKRKNKLTVFKEKRKQ